ncbi:hypothetical protein E2C01_008457 [Portunus trituberculatus]|uniref:Uncharacterized protein n=1 Tax=Portunus trituberculatus TaxID=210409 RepID=A0A5B7D2F7_PORTR|nr:hypothetical protein [Portunus trituberculatus]
MCETVRNITTTQELPSVAGRCPPRATLWLLSIQSYFSMKKLWPTAPDVPSSPPPLHTPHKPPHSKSNTRNIPTSPVGVSHVLHCCCSSKTVTAEP